MPVTTPHALFGCALLMLAFVLIEAADAWLCRRGYPDSKKVPHVKDGLSKTNR
jgi:hypothetical protein